MSDAPELDSIERWMLSVITHPDGEHGTTNSAIEEWIDPSEQQSAAERMAIYTRAYIWRLIEVLGNVYPSVRQVLGDPTFGQACRAYLTAHPSQHYSLSLLGQRFPNWLRGAELNAAPLPNREFLAAVASIEWAMEEVFDAPHADSIDADAVAALAPEELASKRLEVVPGFRLLTLEYPANSFMEALRTRADGEPTPEIPAAEPSHTVVYRSGFTVYRVTIDQAQLAILQAFADGKSLGEALEACAALPGIDLAEVISKLGEWFQDWSGDGMFCAIH